MTGTDLLFKNKEDVEGMIQGGTCYREVGQSFGVSKDVVAYFCKLNGISRGSNRNSEEDAARKIREKTDGRLEYISGYTKKEKPVRVRCVVCDGIFERTFHNITTKGRATCPYCDDKARERKALRKIYEKQSARQKKKAEKFSRSQLIGMRLCVECGELFVPTNRNNIRCSSDCTKKATNRNADARLNTDNTIDRDITLTKLYKRDSGVCYLCGRQCDWNDYETRDDGTVVAGENYPSIEHVKPLSKGGAHSWANVKLSCRGCNTKKGNKIL